MLHRLTTLQVQDSWDFLLPSIEAAIPLSWKDDIHIMEQICHSAINGMLQVWVYKEKEKDISAVLTTTIITDICSGVKRLQIYTIHRLQEDTIEDGKWFKGFDTIKDYARSKGCEHIVSYTRVPGIVERVKKLGGDFDYFVFLEV